MSLVRVTGPEVEPVSLDEARLHLRLDADATDDNALIETLIQAAREHVESETHRAVLPQTWRLTRDCFPCGDVLSLEASDVNSITSFKYIDPSGASVDYAGYTLDVDAMPARVIRDYSTAWPATRVQRNAITVTMKRQMAAAPDDVPAKIKAAMKLLIGHWYENREAVNIGNITTALPMAVDALLAPYRRPAAEMA